MLKRLIEKMSEAAIERYNPELGSAMKKLKRAGADRDPNQAQKALSTLTDRRAQGVDGGGGPAAGAADQQPMNRAAAARDGAHAEGPHARAAAEAHQVAAATPGCRGVAGRRQRLLEHHGLVCDQRAA